MNGNHALRLLSLALCLAVTTVPACSSGGNWFAWGKKDRTKESMGILPPHEEIRLLRDMSERSSKMTPQQKEQHVKMMAQGIQRENDPLVRAEIVKALENFPSPTSATIVMAATKDPDSEVRLAACRVLAKVGDSSAVTKLGELVASDLDPDVRLAATKALGEVRDPGAVAALSPALEDKDPALQRRAVMSLKSSTGKDLGNDVERWRQYVRDTTKSESTVAGRGTQRPY